MAIEDPKRVPIDPSKPMDISKMTDQQMVDRDRELEGFINDGKSQTQAFQDALGKSKERKFIDPRLLDLTGGEASIGTRIALSFAEDIEHKRRFLETKYGKENVQFFIDTYEKPQLSFRENEGQEFKPVDRAGFPNAADFVDFFPDFIRFALGLSGSLAGAAGGGAGAAGGAFVGGAAAEAVIQAVSSSLGLEANEMGMKDRAVLIGIAAVLEGAGELTGGLLGRAFRRMIQKRYLPAESVEEAAGILGAFDVLGRVPEGSTLPVNEARQFGPPLAGLGGPNAGQNKFIGGTPIQDIADNLRKRPGANAPFLNLGQEITAASRKAVDIRVESLTRNAPEQLSNRNAGVVLQSGLDKFMKRFKLLKDELYEDLFTKIGRATEVGVENTRKGFSDILYPFPFDADLGKATVAPGASKLAKKVLESTEIRQELVAFNLGTVDGIKVAEEIKDVGKDTVAFDSLMRLRTWVGTQLTDATVVGDITQEQWKRLYGLISDDIQRAAINAGGPTFRSFKKANRYVKNNIDVIKKQLKPLIDAKTPEQAFLALSTGSKRGETVLSSIRKRVRPQEWNYIVGTILDRLGTTTPTQQLINEPFDLNRFFTNWQALSRDTKKILFKGLPGFRTYAKDLDDIAVIASKLRETIPGTTAPPAGARGSVEIGMSDAFVTGGALGVLAGGTALVSGQGLGTALTAAGGGLSLPFVWFGLQKLNIARARKLYASPKFVHWLAKSQNIKPNRWGAWMGRLITDMAGEPKDVREAAEFFIGSLANISTAVQGSPEVDEEGRFTTEFSNSGATRSEVRFIENGN